MIANVQRRILFGNVFWFLFCAGMLIFCVVVTTQIVLPYLNARYSDPTPVTLSSLLEGTIETPLDFAQVTGSATYDTGYYFETTNYYVFKSSDYYGALDLGSHLLLIFTGEPVTDETQRTWVGTLKMTSAETQREVVQDMESEFPELKDVFLPYTLDMVEAWSAEPFIGIGILLFVAVISIFGLIRALNRFTSRAAHPLWKKLSVYGEDVAATLTKVEKDITANGQKFGTLTIGNEWLVRRGAQFDVMRLKDVVWLYKSSTKHSVNGIRSGTTHAANFVAKNDAVIVVSAREKVVHEMLSAVYKKVPWAVAQYTDEIAGIWQHNREHFIKEVSRRRDEIMAEG